MGYFQVTQEILVRRRWFVEADNAEDARNAELGDAALHYEDDDEVTVIDLTEAFCAGCKHPASEHGPNGCEASGSRESTTCSCKAEYGFPLGETTQKTLF